MKIGAPKKLYPLPSSVFPTSQIPNYYISAPITTAAPNPATTPTALIDRPTAAPTKGLGFGITPVPPSAPPLGAPVPLAKGAIVVVAIIEVLAYGAVPGADEEIGEAEGENEVVEEVEGEEVG